MSTRLRSASAAGAVLLAAARLVTLAAMTGIAGTLAPGGNLGDVGGMGGIGGRAAYAAADPFYLDLLRDGIQSYDRGDYATAAKRLRVACFGMLDEPQQLAACLTRLGLAQAAAGNTDAFRETFRRIVEVEERFGAYSRADLPPEMRDAFEQRALAAVPAGTLETIPSFKALLGRKLEAQVAALPPRERRRQLEERLAKEPRSVVWNVLLAELDLVEGKTAPAVTRAEATAALAPRDPRALCVRGLARAAAKRCAEAIGDLEACPAPISAAGGAAAAGATGNAAGAGDVSGAVGHRDATALLRCRVEVGQWRQAEEQVRALPAVWKQDREIAALMREMAKHPSTAGAPPGGKSASPAPAPAAGSKAPGAVTAGPGAPPAPAAGSKAPGAVTAGPGAPPAAAPAAPSGAAAKGPGPAGSTSMPSGGTAAAPGASGAPAAPGLPKTAGDPKAAAPQALSLQERETMARAEKLLTAAAIPDLRESLRLARQLADAHPDSKAAQYLAGEAAYRNSRWSEAAAFFRRGGPPGDEHPELLFYMAVAYYEVGDRPAAAAALKRSLPNLQRTPFVESYVKRILGQ
jgi:tetratricopeptide (TPR) repeat protein